MNRMLLHVASIVCLGLPAAGSLTAQAAPSAPYTDGSVWQMSFVRVKPGMGDRYDNDLRASWKRAMDEAKRQGIILSYRTLYSEPSDRDDWNVLLMVEYRNMAALDRLRERFDPIAARVLGPAEEREARSIKREDVREVVGGRLAREFILRDSLPPGAAPSR